MKNAEANDFRNLHATASEEALEAQPEYKTG